ncbi:hypothetical protein BpHYR1_039499 [Brachionus plicatilis]|uniref:Uncharacterized protein n=1 Tax=Brachionus plicatilis TaxID=10195 RepID=A0A3M7PAP2_BRAPC|nr:hypothetical protein BpHYR1_039499 [Brachionus plicatilis]
MVMLALNKLYDILKKDKFIDSMIFKSLCTSKKNFSNFFDIFPLVLLLFSQNLNNELTQLIIGFLFKDQFYERLF